MRIKKMSVDGLFGIFDHQVVLNLEDRITIIYGPNGFGKTTILKMLYGVLSGKFFELRNIPFTFFTIDFDDGRTLRIVRSINPQAKRGMEKILDVHLTRGAEQIATTRIKPVSSREVEMPLSVLEQVIPELSRVGSNSWRNIETDETLSLDEVLDRYEYLLPAYRKDAPIRAQEAWLTELREEIPVRFIESQRLTRYADHERRGPWGRALRPAVSVYSEELASQIQRKLAEYGALSQKLDRTFPMRLVKEIQDHGSHQVSSEALTSKLVKLEQKRSKLREVGLLEKEDEKFEAPEAMQELTQQVLPVYVQDTDEKLAVFDDIAAKIETLKGIVNSRFTFKRLDIARSEGFHFVGFEKQPLSVTQLSSGEQHMLVLLAELLFATKPNSLVLIDEPEISLHVAWQHDFLEDLQRVAKLSELDILIATHSPQIINNRWSLTVELQAPLELTV